MNPREAVDLELNLITQVFDKQKVVHPMVVFIKDDRRTIAMVEFHSDAHKDMMSEGIKQLVRESMPDLVIYTAEAWRAFVPEYIEGVTPRPALHPDRVEVIIARIEFKTGEKYDCEAKILREKGQARLDKFEIMPGGMSMGRFVDFFPIGRTN
jgi:hypothetical protein